MQYIFFQFIIYIGRGTADTPYTTTRAGESPKLWEFNFSAPEQGKVLLMAYEGNYNKHYKTYALHGRQLESNFM